MGLLWWYKIITPRPRIPRIGKELKLINEAPSQKKKKINRMFEEKSHGYMLFEYGKRDYKGTFKVASSVFALKKDERTENLPSFCESSYC